MTFTSTYFEDEHRHVDEEVGIEIVIERFRTNREGDVVADVQPREAVGDGFLPSEKLNLSSARSIKSYAKTLSERPLQGQIDWFALLSKAAQDSVLRLRDGEPHVMLRDVELGALSRWLVCPFLVDRAISMIYGAGGSTKSILAALFAVVVASGEEIAGLSAEEPGPVLVLDWEDDAETWAERMRAIATGAGLDPDDLEIAHQRMTASLHDSAREMRKKAATLNARLVIIDSVGMASGGDPNDPGTIMRCLLAARSLHVPVLAIHHIAKDVKDPVKSGPYGTVYSNNEVRLSHYVASEQRGSETTVVLTPSKTNRTGELARGGFRLAFSEAGGLLDEIAVSPIEMHAMPRDEASPSNQRYDLIKWLLEVQSATAKDAADFLGTSEQRARNLLNDTTAFVKVGGTRPSRYGVLDEQTQGLETFTPASKTKPTPGGLNKAPGLDEVHISEEVGW